MVVVEFVVVGVAVVDDSLSFPANEILALHVKRLSRMILHLV